MVASTNDLPKLWYMLPFVLPSRHVEPQHVTDDQAHQERGDGDEHQVAQAVPSHSAGNSTPILPPLQVGTPDVAQAGAGAAV